MSTVTFDAASAVSSESATAVTFIDPASSLSPMYSISTITSTLSIVVFGYTRTVILLFAKFSCKAFLSISIGCVTSTLSGKLTVIWYLTNRVNDASCAPVNRTP